MGCNYYNKILKIDFLCLIFFFNGNKDNSNSLSRIKQGTQSQKKMCTNATYSFSHSKIRNVPVEFL